MTKTSLVLVCALVLGCSSSDDGGGTTADTGTTPTDTGTTSNDGASDTGEIDTGTAGDTGTASDTGTAGDSAGETSTGAASCSDYCAKVTTNCSGTVNGQYVNTGGKSEVEMCGLMCAKMATGMTTDTSGDTVGCRLGFANAAATTTPDANCRKAGPYGGAACGADRCTDFCKLALAQCPAAFADMTECKTKCGAMPYDATKPEVDPTAVGKLNCVFYHLEAAYAAPATHCGHLTVTTSGTPCTP